MDFITKQKYEKNKTAFGISIIITSVVIVITLLGFIKGANIQSVLRLVVAIEVIGFNFVTHARFKQDEKYMHCCCSSMIVLFVVSIGTASTIMMYPLFFPIAMLVMLFSDNRLALVGSALGTGGVVVFAGWLLSRGLTNANEFVFATLFAASTAVCAIWVIKTQNRLNTESLNEVQKGADVQTKTAEEIATLVGELNFKFQSAKEVSDTLNETMTTSHSSVSEIAESTKVNAQAIEQQTSQTSDIQQSIEAVGAEAKNMGEVSIRTNATVDEGVRLIQKLKRQAAEVAEINLQTRETTQMLKETIQAVQDITETILGISNQTNLLALNASIEAARAGEAGKGFAVVADEIRTLSEDTRVATEQIGDIIEKLTRDADSAADSMKHSADVAEKQNEIIEETSSKLLDIKDDTDALYEGVRQVNDSVDSIISANTRIMDSITNLSATGQQVAASSDTALSISDTTMEALEDMNALLNDISVISKNMGMVARKNNNG